MTTAGAPCPHFGNKNHPGELSCNFCSAVLTTDRKRQLLADASSVQLTRNPRGLADALAKIPGVSEPLEEANRATQHLDIVNPVKVFGTDASALMSAHPPSQERIRGLRSMA